LTAQRDKLKQENAATAAQQQNIDKIKKQTADIKDQTTGLATVFDQLKPWSAMLQDIRDRTPAGVQITCVAQTLPSTSTDSLANCQAVQPATSTPPAPAAATAVTDPTIPTTDMVVISGRTYDYNNINNLILVLQQSPFFRAEQTKLLTSELKDFPSGEVQLAQLSSNNIGGGTQPKPTKVVEFTIKTHLSDKPASDPILLRELQRKGALGLVTRIETLQQKGVLQNDLRR
jgi:type IV pilus assembly protein PilN